MRGSAYIQALGGVLLCILVGCDEPSTSRPTGGQGQVRQMPQTEFEIIKTDAEWRQALTPEQYRIARQKGTEPAFAGEYWNTKTDGLYVCVCCSQPLYDSRSKYDSGSGWPSFWAPVDEKSVINAVDTSLARTRSEVLCSRCGAHLGHVFEDGPEPTGLRHCINSTSLKLVARSDKSK